MNKNKHLTQSNRVTIESLLNEGKSFKFIGRELSKDPTTIAKEVKNHILFKKTGAYGRVFNDCLLRNNCTASFTCKKPNCRRKMCKFCSEVTCTSVCSDYQNESCPHLLKPPYVCNGCEKRSSCTLEKRLYSASHAHKEYRDVLSESRQGLQLSESEFLRLDTIISPLLRKGQSLHHICLNHKDKLMCVERTLYNYVDLGMFSARNIDMPRKVRMSRRKPSRINFKVDKSCRIRRTHQDFLSYIAKNPSLPIVEMDSVEGKKGGKVLLTLHFTVPQFMLAFIRDANTSQSVIDIIDRLYLELNPDIFCNLFEILLGDNGSEFSNPMALEFDTQGNRRTNVFYCDPSASFQKGAIENNHEMIRRVIPKGQSMDEYTQDDISLMMNHINSYARKNLGDKSPYEVFASLYGEAVLRRMGAILIPPDEVTLHPSLLKK